MLRPDPAQRRLVGFTLGAAILGWAMIVLNAWEHFA